MAKHDTPIQQEELELLRRCQEGDLKSFAQIIDRYKQKIFGMIYRWVGEKQISEDLAQEVFLKLYRELKNYRGEAKFSTWLYQVTLNCCRDHWRKQQRRRGEEEFQDGSIGGRTDPKIEEIVEAKETATHLRKVLASLPPIYQEAVYLRFFGEMSYEEIAEATGVHLSNVKMRVARGLVQLRKRMHLGD